MPREGRGKSQKSASLSFPNAFLRGMWRMPRTISPAAANFNPLRRDAGFSLQEGIVFPLEANRSQIAVPRIDDHVLRQHKELFADRADNLRRRSAGQVSPANAAAEQSVAGKQPRD